MSAGKTYWWAKDAAWLDREAVVELGVQFGPGGPLVEACAPDAHAELELVEVVQILCRRVRSLERQLAEARR